MSVTSYKPPGTVTEDTSNPSDHTSNVVTNYANWTGSTTATIGWATGTRRSYRYKLTNFGFTTADVPAGSTINGFGFTYTRRENGTTDNLGLRSLFIIKSDGTVVTTTNVSDQPAEWPTTAGGVTQTLPSDEATNVWGYTGAVATDIIDTDFGIAVEFWTTDGTSNAGGTTPDSDTIKDLQVRIYYTEASGSTYNDTLSIGMRAGASTSAVAVPAASVSLGSRQGIALAAAQVAGNSLSFNTSQGFALVGSLQMSHSLSLNALLGFSFIGGKSIDATFSLASTVGLTAAANWSFSGAISIDVRQGHSNAAAWIWGPAITATTPLGLTNAPTQTLIATSGFVLPVDCRHTGNLNMSPSGTFGLRAGLSFIGRLALDNAFSIGVRVGASFATTLNALAAIVLGNRVGYSLTATLVIYTSTPLGARVGLSESAILTGFSAVAIGASLGQTIVAGLAIDDSISIPVRVGLAYGASVDTPPPSLPHYGLLTLNVTEVSTLSNTFSSITTMTSTETTLP